MNGGTVRRILLCAVMALAAFGAVWGLYIAALLITLSSRGDASYAIGLCAAMAVQLIVYKVAPRRFTRLQRWISCAAAPLVIMLIFAKLFKGGGNFEMLGGSFNVSLLIAMLCFAAFTGTVELCSHFLLHRPKNSDDDEDDEDDEDGKDGEDGSGEG